MYKKLFQKIIVVIFLTVFFNIIAVTILNPLMLVSVFMGVTVVATVMVIAFTNRKVNQINQSIPSFLNFVNLTMSTGKSLASSFEIAILYQKKSIQPFYRRIYHLIFYIKDLNSSFYFNVQTNFYKNIFQISSQNSQQREKIHKLKQQTIGKLEVQRREKSLRAPFLIQTYIFCILFSVLLSWHFSFRASYPQIEFLSITVFVFGLILSFLIGKPSKKI